MVEDMTGSNNGAVSNIVKNTKHININDFIQGKGLSEKYLIKSPTNNTTLLKQEYINKFEQQLDSPLKFKNQWKSSMQEYTIKGVQISNGSNEAKAELEAQIDQKYDDAMKMFLSNLTSEISSARLKSQSRRNIRSQMNARENESSQSI